MSKIELEVAEDLEFEDGDCAVIIKQDGSVGKVIMPKMDAQMVNSPGYRSLLEVLDLLQPGSKEEFIKYNEKKTRRIH